MSCFYSFLQVVVVGQNLHQKVKLECLGLQEGNDSDGMPCVRKEDKTCVYLWSLHLDPPQAARAINDSVFRNDFTGVDLTERSDDATIGEDHVPSNISWATGVRYCYKGPTEFQRREMQLSHL